MPQTEKKVRLLPQAALWDPRFSEAYGDAILLVKALVKSLRQGPPASLSFEPYLFTSRQLLALLKEDSDGLLALANRSTPDVYLYAHCVNVAIFSLRVGQLLGLTGDELEGLGAAALLHDLG